MPSIKTILAFLAALAASLVAVFKARADQAKAERDQARQDAAIAKQVNEANAIADRAARKLSEKQRQETIDERKKIDQGVRDQLDTDW